MRLTWLISTFLLAGSTIAAACVGTDITADGGDRPTDPKNDAAGSQSSGTHGDGEADAGDTDVKTDSGRQADSSGNVDSGQEADSGVPIQQHCVDQINSYRQSLALPPLARVDAEESCADNQAKSDAIAVKAHSTFSSCGELAQSECVDFPSADMRGGLDACLAQMWAQGPGPFNASHSDYINMTSTAYTKVFCGFHDLGNGKFWSVVDYE